MIFKIINWTVMAVALFYGLEGIGIIEKGKYFPTLPRLEASASDPSAWLGAAQWGFNQLGGLAQSRGGADFPTANLAGITGAFSGAKSSGSGQSITGSISNFVGGSGGGTGGYRMNYLSGYK